MDPGNLSHQAVIPFVAVPQPARLYPPGSNSTEYLQRANTSQITHGEYQTPATVTAVYNELHICWRPIDDIIRRLWSFILPFVIAILSLGIIPLLEEHLSTLPQVGLPNQQLDIEANVEECMDNGYPLDNLFEFWKMLLGISAAFIPIITYLIGRADLSDSGLAQWSFGVMTVVFNFAGCIPHCLTNLWFFGGLKLNRNSQHWHALLTLIALPLIWFTWGFVSFFATITIFILRVGTPSTLQNEEIDQENAFIRTYIFWTSFCLAACLTSLVFSVSYLRSIKH